MCERAYFILIFYALKTAPFPCNISSSSRSSSHPHQHEHYIGMFILWQPNACYKYEPFGNAISKYRFGFFLFFFYSSASSSSFIPIILFIHFFFSSAFPWCYSSDSRAVLPRIYHRYEWGRATFLPNEKHISFSLWQLFTHEDVCSLYLIHITYTITNICHFMLMLRLRCKWMVLDRE